MKSFLVIAIAFLFVLTSCNKQTADVKPVAPAMKTVSYDELYSNTFDAPKGKVIVEGLCIHVCKHSGKKIFVIGTDPNKKIQIYAGEGLSGFPQDVEGSKVRVVGILEEEKLDMKSVQQMEEDLNTEVKEQLKSNTKSCVFEDEMKKIKDLKDKISKSPKGYFSLYSMTSTEYKKI